MGEHIFRVALSDLAVVRVTCGKCAATIEHAFDGLAHTFKSGKCPCCGVKWTNQDFGGELAGLEGAIQSLATKADDFRVEFPVKLPS